MWVTCAQPVLLKAVQLVSRAISTRTTMPILGYILMETKKDGVKLTATDLELAIQTDVEAEVKQGGQMTLPARIFTEIVGNLSPATVEIKGQEGAAPAEISCETSHFEILGLPAGDFPTLPRTNGEPVASIEADVARMMVNQTIFAVSADETRPFLTGVYVVMEGSEARFVATDGGRLALRKVTLPQAARQKVGVIVHAQAMSELGRALASAAGPVQLETADNQLVFSVPGLRVFSRLISGQFPNYQQVIPQEFKQRLRIQTERLLRAVRRASITARDSANVVRLSAMGKKLTIIRPSPTTTARPSSAPTTARPSRRSPSRPAKTACTWSAWRSTRSASTPSP